MTEKNSGPEEAIKGVVEGAKGKAKEVIGAVAGRAHDDVALLRLAAAFEATGARRTTPSRTPPLD